ncbi:MAG: mshA 1 [Clostridia bacterium]|jgi:glycosyltransferase involved in cell wall biosynthesis|nr:mshA 1 [Clostridia bacterium]
MNILFSHDHILKRDPSGGFYSAGGLGGNRFADKYIKNRDVDKLILYTRVKNIKNDEEDKCSFLDANKIICNPSHFYKKPIDYFRFNKKIIKEIEEILIDIDVCIIRLPSVLGSLVYKEATKKSIPIFVELVGCPWDSIWNYGNFKGKMFAPLMYFKTKRIVKNSKYIQYVSEKFLQRRYPTNGNSLACSDVVINDLEETILENKIKKIQNKESDKFILGVVGSLNVSYKGHEVCIKALSLLKDKLNFELHFLGNGNKEKWIDIGKKYNIEDRIFFDGTLPSGEPVLNWLDNLDIHLIMSKTEGLPRILVEAMSRASISIGSNVGEIPTLINKECIVEKNNYKQLAYKIEKILNNKEFQILTASENFNRAKDFYNVKLDKKRKIFYNDFLVKENLIYE